MEAIEYKMQECSEVVYSEDYFDIISEYTNVEVQGGVDVLCPQIISQKYSCVYVDINDSEEISVRNYSYSAIPNLYGLMDINAVDATNAERLSNFPGLELKGENVIVGFVDTGIDIFNELFINKTGQTRIMAIWDQTLNSDNHPEKFDFGTEFDSEKINEMIRENAEYVGDSKGHGTALAGIACGNEAIEAGFTGVAVMSDIVVVKLKEAKKNLKDYYLVDEEIQAYGENDIMMGISYLLSVAEREKRPIVIVLGLGTSMGDHSGGSPLGQYLNDISTRIGVCVVVSAGNEGAYRLHYSGVVKGSNSVDVELRVGANEYGITMEIWGQSPDIFSVGFISPLGEVVDRIPARVGVSEKITFLLEKTEIDIDYKIVESASGEELILLRIKNPTEGIWTVRVYGSNVLEGVFNAWLPLRQFMKSDTYFLQSTPDMTITEPGNAPNIITVAAYNSDNNSILLESGRVYSADNRVKPELASPGVNVLVPKASGFITGGSMQFSSDSDISVKFERASGTSIAASLIAGICALYLEWGIVRENDNYIRTSYIKSYLIRGAVRMNNVDYPNRQNGFGYVDAFNSFAILVTS